MPGAHKPAGWPAGRLPNDEGAFSVICPGYNLPAVMGPTALDALEHALGVTFRDPALLRQAFIHRSYLNERPGEGLHSNERLEYLGDSVLGFVVSEYLYRTFPDASEGQLTTVRAAVVRTEMLTRLALALDLGSYLLLSKGEEASGGRSRPGVLARTMEALIGGLYLDRGLEAVRSVLEQCLAPEIRAVVDADASKDAKSKLQELAQAELGVTPVYRMTRATGPDHAKRFEVDVLIGDRVAGRGEGGTKQRAEQRAASHALAQWVRRDDDASKTA